MNNYLSPRNYGCRITEFTYLGYKALSLQNECLRITLLPGKGTDVIEFLYKPLDVDFMWLSYPGLSPTGSPFLNASESSTGFMDHYPGGWQEILPNFGEPCIYKGATLGLHGEVSLLPWRYTIVQDDPSCVSAEFFVRCLRTPFTLRKTMTLGGGPVLKLHEQLKNVSAETMDCTWGHHPAFGGSFLDENCRIYVPPCRIKTQDEYSSPNSRLEKSQDAVWPLLKGRHGETIDLSRIPPPSVKSHDNAILYGYSEGWFAVTNPRKNIGFAMAWDSALFKYIGFWQVFGGWSGYPWYGMTYNIGLEPRTSFPSSLPKAIENATQLSLAPGELVQTQLCAVV